VEARDISFGGDGDTDWVAFTASAETPDQVRAMREASHQAKVRLLSDVSAKSARALLVRLSGVSGASMAH
jgi:hypothetical protein